MFEFELNLNCGSNRMQNSNSNSLLIHFFISQYVLSINMFYVYDISETSDDINDHFLILGYVFSKFPFSGRTYNPPINLYKNI